VLKLLKELKRCLVWLKDKHTIFKAWIDLYYIMWNQIYSKWSWCCAQWLLLKHSRSSCLSLKLCQKEYRQECSKIYQHFPLLTKTDKILWIQCSFNVICWYNRFVRENTFSPVSLLFPDQWPCDLFKIFTNFSLITCYMYILIMSPI